ncbi:unnamed protein product [Nezara viridula]|uniref:Uncharacterized protein n=1 Tax=Nezara viridula TaxID=85310 RepID=A0A9P0H6Q4_NEZVI|nr:unnamed protein product [Nezara viridula]
MTHRKRTGMEAAKKGDHGVWSLPYVAVTFRSVRACRYLQWTSGTCTAVVAVKGYRRTVAYGDRIQREEHVVGGWYHMVSRSVSESAASCPLSALIGSVCLLFVQ